MIVMASCVKLAHTRVAMERLARKSSTHLQGGCPRPTACTSRRPHEATHRLCARRPDNLARRYHVSTGQHCVFHVTAACITHSNRLFYVEAV
ncbi:hypothetical protein BHE74_00041308, partial [Ensete ventricosum]